MRGDCRFKLVLSFILILYFQPKPNTQPNILYPLSFILHPFQRAAHPSGTAGFSSGTSSPGDERETLPSEDESHINISRKRNPSSLSGRRTEMRVRISKLAPSTPTAKKAKAFACSPARTRSAALFHLSVGSPSLIKKIQGR